MQHVYSIYIRLNPYINKQTHEPYVTPWLDTRTVCDTMTWHAYRMWHHDFRQPKLTGHVVGSHAKGGACLLVYKARHDDLVRTLFGVEVRVYRWSFTLPFTPRIYVYIQMFLVDVKNIVLWIWIFLILERFLVSKQGCTGGLSHLQSLAPTVSCTSIYATHLRHTSMHQSERSRKYISEFGLGI